MLGDQSQEIRICASGSTVSSHGLSARVVSILLPTIVITGRVVDQDDAGAEAIPARSYVQQ